MESGEGNVDESCIDTSLPTDVSLSQDDASEMGDILKSNENFSPSKVKHSDTTLFHRISSNYDSGDHAKVFKAQMLKNELLKMNVQLKEKSIKMDALKAENFHKIESLESKLNHAMRENALLKTQLKMERQEMAQVKTDLMQKLNDIESKQGYLKVASLDIQRVLQTACITEHQYNTLLSTNHDQLSITDFISKHMYEMQKRHADSMEEKRASLKEKQQQLHNQQLSIDQLKDDLDKERQARVEVEVRLERSGRSLEVLKQRLSDDDFKSNHYDTLHKERDELEMRLADVGKEHQHVSSRLETTTASLTELQDELKSLKQCNSLLTKDKLYLSQVSEELTGKVSFLEGRCHYLEVQNDKLKVAREDLYEKYIATRDQYKREHDEKLREELDRMSRQMEEDIGRVKQANRDVTEREIGSLREARDMALAEKRAAIVSEKEVAKKYEVLLLDFRQKQMWSEGLMGDLQNELKVKSFEYQKLQILLEETMNNLKESQLSYDKLQKKMEVLMKEYYCTQVTFEKRNSELEALLKFKESQVSKDTPERMGELAMEVTVMRNKIFELETERNNLSLEKKQMAQDLQKLLQHDQEMTQLKAMVQGAKSKSASRKAAKHHQQISFTEAPTS